VIRHGLVLQTALDLLARLGIRVTPYHLVEESFEAAGGRIREARIPDLRMRRLEPADAPAVGAMPEGDVGEDEARRRLETGIRGFGAWAGGELVAYMWAHLDELDHEPCRRPLAPDEGYLYGARTARSCRGLGLGPALRTALYQHLAAEGRTRLLSVSYAFNQPAIRFKRKLNARLIERHVAVVLWGRWRRDWRVPARGRSPS
jgi:ribosomal protein S18 acetylase RimI-like enzyme